MRIGVTGASGFLGGFLVEALGRSHAVVPIPGRAGLAERLERAGAEGLDALLHFGGAVDYAPQTGPVGGDDLRSAELIRDAMRRHRIPHLVFASGAAVLGVSATPRARNEDDLGTTDEPFAGWLNTRYVQQKLAAGRLLTGEGWTTTTLYLTTVYGPGMPAATLAALRGLTGLLPLVPCPPGGTSWLGLDDLGQAVERVLARRPAAGLVLSSGNTSYAELLDAAAAAQGVRWRKRLVRLPRRARPLVERLAALPARRGGWAPAVHASSFGWKYYSCARAQQLLGWAPRARLPLALASALA